MHNLRGTLAKFSPVGELLKKLQRFDDYELDVKNVVPRQNYKAKRVIDIIVSASLLVFFFPLISFIGIWISLTSRGPIFYTQTRGGLFEKPIRIIKLRTMYLDADKRLIDYLQNHPDAKKEWKTFFKLKNDPRILPGIGSFLRKSSLDELPQLWNVLRGDMSLVGPRPFPDYHLAEFSLEFRALRASVWPGLTGYWQITERSRGDLAVQEALDTYYIENWSIWLDIAIIFKTVGAVLLGRGAH